MNEPTNPMTLPLRQTPVVFRWWLASCLVAVACSFAALLSWAPGPNLTVIVHEPGALILLALVLLADLYPTLPWMRNSNPFDDFILSTPLLIAALMVYGPHAAVAFLIAGAAMTIAMRMKWWRVLLNIALWGLQGAAAAGVLLLITGSFTWDTPMSSAAMVPVTIVLAIVIEGLNVVLVGTSVNLVGASTWRENVADWRQQIAIGTLALTAPIPAVIAIYQPGLLPLLALAMVAALSGMSAVSSRTSAAGTDPLTRVGNRAAFTAALRARLDQPYRVAGSVTLLLVDLDRFKLVNDVHGHLTGDNVLVEVAQRLEESTRADDLVARLGGDEFAVLLASGVTSRTAREVADRITGAVAKPMTLGERTLQVGVSIGWAVASAGTGDPTALMERADAELYRVKAARHRQPATETPVRTGSDPAGRLWHAPEWSLTHPEQLCGVGGVDSATISKS